MGTGRERNNFIVRPEVLAPAGSMEALRAAVYAGADAVYVGGSQFGARAFAENFTTEELLSAIDFVHKYDMKLYMTVNTLLKEKEIKEELFPYLLPFYEHGLDAVIVQDMGVLRRIREWFPDLDIHASTQMGILSEEGARWVQKLGVVRVVPGRELSLREVSRIAAIPNLSVECFVHGALCYCYSGQCFLSSRIGGRSGNRGRCAQPCRLPYQIAGEQETASHMLSPKDMCTIELLPELIKAGITSFKIEGRMKKPEYVAAVTSRYRKYTDLALECIENGKPYKVEKADQMLLMQMYNRGGFSEGYYHQHNGSDMMECLRPNHHGVFVGTIHMVGRNTITFRAEQELYPQDVLEIRLSNSRIELTSPVSAKCGQQITLKANQMRKLKTGIPVFRMKSPYLIRQLMEEIQQNQDIELTGKTFFEVGKPAQFSLCDKNGNQGITVYGAEVSKALKQPLMKEQLDKALRQTGGSGYRLASLKIEMAPDSFLPMKAIKELRRKALAEYERTLLQKYYRTDLVNQTKEEEVTKITNTCGKKLFLDVSVHNGEQLAVALANNCIRRIFVPVELIEEMPLGNKNHEIYAVLPRMFRLETGERLDFEKLVSRADGVLVNTVDALAWVKKQALKTEIQIGVVLGDTMYAYNQPAVELWKQALRSAKYLDLTGMIAPSELSFSEISKVQYDFLTVPVYGRRTMMTSAQCIKKTMHRCDHIPSYHLMKDRKGKAFVSESVCRYCYNVLWEEEPLSLTGCGKDVKKLQPDAVKLDFTWELTKEVEAIIRIVYEEYCLETPNVTYIEGNTGHYYNGID